MVFYIQARQIDSATRCAARRTANMRWNNRHAAATIPTIIATALCVAGCADNRALSAQERNSHFEETGGDQFRFTAVVNAQYPEDDPKAEAARQRWLNDDLVMSNRCSDGNAST